jgi:hypothetical protein
VISSCNILSIKLLGKVLILNGLDADLSLYEISNFHNMQFDDYRTVG